MSLAALNARVAHDLACLNWGEDDWLTRRPGTYDVAIVGGGQSGLGAAFGLMRERVGNILVIDECPAGREGPWDSYARMATLRTPKHLNSIEQGIPSLGFRAWWEAKHGREGWEALGKIPRGEWMAYLRWYRDVLDLPVRNDTRLTRIEPLGDGTHRLHLASAEPLRARKVILATGIQGGGQWHTPAFIRDSLPRDRYAHTSQAIDFGALSGKRIAILGGGASAFDNAATALAGGATKVDVHIRREELPRINPIRYMERTGLVLRYPALDDAQKYEVMEGFFARSQPPTVDMFEAAAAYPGFDLRTGSPWLSVEPDGGAVKVTTPSGAFTYDFLILSTGLVTDPTLRPELADVESRIARWADRYTPPAGTANRVIDTHPYLGPGFELTPRTREDAAALHGLFAFNYSALISLGLSASAISGLKHALPRLVAGVVDQLFRDDADAILAGYQDFAEHEFTAEWPRGGDGETGEEAA